MKKLLITTGLLLLNIIAFSQDVLDQELKKLADQLAPRLLKQGNKRVAVINFTNLENQPTALGKALAEMFTIELTNTDLILINRAQLNKLIEENKMMADGFLDEKEVVKLGQLKKVDLIVTGTATPLDKTVMLTLQATDIMLGTVVGGVKGNITRTNAIESLMRDRVGDNIDENNMKPSDGVLPQQAPTNNNYVSPDGNTQQDMPLNKCLARGGWTAVRGEICFENRTGQSFEIYKYSGGHYRYDERMMVGSNSRNCFGLITTGEIVEEDVKKKNFPSLAYIFYVRTTEEDEDKRKYGEIRMTVDGCKTTTKVIDKSRIFFDKKKP
jgi:TolB-like protein